MEHLPITERDADGNTIFPWIEWCECEGCKTLRAQQDSYTIGRLSRLWPKAKVATFRKMTAKPSEKAEAKRICESVHRDFADTFFIWEPACPVWWH